MPPEFQGLGDEEIAAEIRERLRDVGGDAFVRVGIECHDRKVVLSGEIPSEEDRSIARQVVDDLAGLSPVDRMRVTIGWEKSERVSPAPPETPELDRAEGVETINENPLDPDEGYEPPDRPITEKT